MAAEDKEVTIVIKGKNLTDGEFAAARKNIAGVRDETARATSSFKDSFKSLQSVGQMFGVTMGAAAVVGFAKHMLASADALTKLSDKTGIAIEPMQRLKFAAEQSGNTLDQVTGAVTQMQRRLAEGDNSAAGALRTLGLSFEQLQRLTPDQQFIAIAREVATIEDPMQRVKVAMDLFGKSGADVLPTLIADVDALAKKAPVMSANAVKAFADIGDAIDESVGKLKNFSGEAIGGVIDETRRLVAAAKELATGDFGRAYEFLADVADVALPKLPPALNAVIAPTQGVALSFADMDRVSKELTKSVEAKAKAVEKAAEADKKAREAQKEFAAAVDYFGTRANYANYNALVPYAAALSDAGAKADILEATLPPLASSADVATRALEEAWRATRKYVEMTGTAATNTGLFRGVLDNLGNTILKAFQGGGDVLKSIGASIGVGLGENFVSSFGASITKSLPSFLGNAINSLIPGLGSLLGPLMGKIGGFFKGLFGGVSDDVKRSRVDVDQFQASLAATLTAQQQAEAGGEKWKMTVIAVRDAYLATGRTAGEAEAIVRQLWDTDHPDRARKAIEEINRVLDQQKSKFGAIDDLAGDAAGAIEREFRGRAIPALEDMYDAIDAVNFGHSPGGLKEIPLLAGMGATSIGMFRDSVVAHFASVESSLDQVLLKFGKFSGGIPTTTIQSKNGETPGPFEGYVKPTIDLISEADAIKRAREVAAFYGATLSDADLGELAKSYGYGGQGQLSKERFESFLQDLAERYVESRFAGFAIGTSGEFPDFRGGTPAMLHGREAVVPYHERIPTAQKWLGGEGGIQVHVTLNVEVDKNGNVRASSSDADHIVRVVQHAMSTAQLQVPQRIVAGRPG